MTPELPFAEGVCSFKRLKQRAPLTALRDEVHLWHVFTDVVRRTTIDHCVSLLDDRERARHDRLRFQKVRDEFAISHAVVRLALSRYADVNPRAWTFETNRFGRPSIAGPTSPLRLHFSLSHTDGLVACAIALSTEVGLDIQDVAERAFDHLKIAEHFFSPVEIAALRAAPVEARSLAFFQYWTLKEAYAKARGRGLSLPLDKFWFELDGQTPRICCESEAGDDPRGWHFTLFSLSSRHVVATAVRKCSRRPRICLRDALRLLCPRE